MAGRSRKYGNKSVRAHLNQGFEVYPINPQAEEIEGLRAYPSLDQVPPGRLDRVSLYVPPKVGAELLDEIARRGCDQLWFNPGSESPELIDRARELGLNAIVACSIVNVGENPNELR